MKPYYKDDTIEIYNQGCLEGLKGLAASSVDLICTDPPYGYSFMNKPWDTFEPKGAYQDKKGFKQLPRNQPFAMTEFFVPIWTECLRVLKPGAFAFVMCAPRQDVLSKQISALQDAGFNMGFSSLYHTYASGFPKASNIGKMVDKRLGAKREVVGKKSCGYQVSISKKRKEEGYRPNLTKATTDVDVTEPATPQAKVLDGSYGGFQPKPAVEIILVCMKPLSEKTYVDQALKNRKGITWLDSTRIPYESEGDKEITQAKANLTVDTSKDKYGGGYKERLGDFGNPTGRFPANLIVSDDVLNDGRVRTSGKGNTYIGQGGSRTEDYFGPNVVKSCIGDSGSFSRYFDIDSWWNKRLEALPDNVKKTFPFLIVPKASKAEKNRGCEGMLEKDAYNLGHKENPGRKAPKKSLPRANYHPTCKPIKLFSYLLILGSCEGDVVLDPFIGSGTTAIAAKILGRKCIGFEMDEGYCKIAAARCQAPVQGRL